MRNLILTAVICFLTTNLFSQTYKLEPVFSEKATETYLSHWKVLEPELEAHTDSDTFSLWGYHLYFDDWVDGAYEVEYFKGNANEVFDFLTAVNQFFEKYKDEDQIITRISGVKVKIMKGLGFRYTCIFDRDDKVICKFNRKDMEKILTQFTSYCDEMNINYQKEAD